MLGLFGITIPARLTGPAIKYTELSLTLLISSLFMFGPLIKNKIIIKNNISLQDFPSKGWIAKHCSTHTENHSICFPYVSSKPYLLLKTVSQNRLSLDLAGGSTSGNNIAKYLNINIESKITT